MPTRDLRQTVSGVDLRAEGHGRGGQEAEVEEKGDEFGGAVEGGGLSG